MLEADGTPMSVCTALQVINRFFAEDDFDHDTQFCLAWFEQQGWATGKFGDADAQTKGGTPIWEALHQLIHALHQDGETAAGTLLARMPSRADPMRAQAYRLYTLCERKGWAEDARAYNELVTAWQSVGQAANEAGVAGSQTTLDM